MHDRKLICVIDDDDRLRRAICTVLSDAGYATVEAPDGEAGLKLVDERKPAVVVTDIVMPNREGIETIQALRERFAELPVLAISGSFNPNSLDYLDLAREMGASDCLAKPFKPAELLAKVGALAALWQ
jgi:DNA-binding response OmpR family regulator